MHNPSDAEAHDDLGSAGTQIAPELPVDLLDEVAPERPAPHFHRWLLLYGVVVFALVLLAQWSSPISAGAPWPGLLTLPRELLPTPLPPVWQQAIGIVAQLAGTPPPLAAVRLAMLAQALLLAVAVVGAMALIMLHRPGIHTVFQHGMFFQATFLALAILYKGAFLSNLVTQGSPAVLSAAFAAMALLALGFFLHGEFRASPETSTSSGKGLLLLAALCLGAGCADQPYFLILVPFGVSLCLRRPVRRIERLLHFLVPLTFMLIWPTLRYLENGGTPSDLLAHLLRLPFPDASMSPAAFEFGNDLHLGIPFIFLVLIGLFLLPRTTNLRWVIGALLLMALLLGPAMPLLANPPTVVPLPVDYMAPVLLAWVLFVVAILVALLARLSAKGQVLVTTTVALAFLMELKPIFENGAHNPSAFQQEVEALFAEVPEGATVVARNTEMAAALWGLQQVHHQRPDLRIVPIQWLGMPGARRAAGERLALTLSEDFPSAEAVDRWAAELPLHAAALQADDLAALEAGLADFAAWDLATLECPQDSVWFLGVQVRWLLTRGERRGAFLVYPPTGASVQPQDLAVNLPWGQAIRDVIKAETLAQRRDALREPRHPFDVRVPVKDPIREALTEALRVAREGDGVLTDALRTDTDTLWRADKLQLLQSVYEVLTQAKSPDPESWYQLAAVHAQLGHWGDTTTALGKWMEAFPDGNGNAFGRINSDGRFAVYLRKAGGGPVPLPEGL